MNGRFLLDTSVVIALLNGRQEVVSQLADADEVFLPVIVLGELYYGALCSMQVSDNLDRIAELASECSVLGVNAMTAHEYGSVKQLLRNKGRPIPENDVWIAALARQHDLVLVTRDEHFRAVDGLSQVQW